MQKPMYELWPFNRVSEVVQHAVCPLPLAYANEKRRFGGPSALCRRQFSSTPHRLYRHRA